MTDLRTLRPYLDALADETLGRVLDAKPATPPRRRATAWLVAAAVVATLVTGSAVVLTRSSTSSPEIASTSPQPTAAVDSQRLSLDNPDCIRTETNSGCERTPSEAGSMLGFDIQTPTQIPDGWTTVGRVVRVYPRGVPPNDTPQDIAEYSQVWAPSGLIEPGSTQAKYVQLRERAVLPTDACFDSNRFYLADGTEVCGTVDADSTTNVPGAYLSFIRDGVYFRLISFGLLEDQVLNLLNSLTR